MRRSFGTLQEFGSSDRFTIEIFTRGNRNAAQAGIEPLHLFRRALTRMIWENSKTCCPDTM